MKKRLLSILLTVCMVFGLLPGLTQPAMAATHGSFTVTYDGLVPSYDNSTLTLGTGIYTITGTGTATTDKIVVSSGAMAYITLNGVNIDVSGTYEACAFDMSGATVYLTLSGTNVLKSGSQMAGLRVPTGASLTITGAGSLEATSAGGPIAGAGIGGSSGEGCGAVTIAGGTVTATGGGTSVSANGAGIGGGGGGPNAAGGAGGTVIINGGYVTAKGVRNSAGIGGGGTTNTSDTDTYGGGVGGTVTITGGTVIATGGEWRGAGIGGGGGKYSGGGAMVTITGGSVKATGGGTYGAAIGAGASNSAAGTNHGTLKNDGGTDYVTLYTLTLSGVSSATAVTGLSLPGGYAYGTTDMMTDNTGNLYVYLPAGKTGAASATTATGTYTGTIAANAANLTLPPLTYDVTGSVNVGSATGASVSGLTVNLYKSTDVNFITSIGSATTDDIGGTYTISDVPAGSYVARVEGEYGSHAASVSGTITVIDDDVAGVTIPLVALTTQSIAVKSDSHKIAYYVNDSLDVTNLKITVTRSDNSTYDKDVTAGMVSGFNSAVTGSQTLTITFDSKTATYVISVSRAAYTGDTASAPELVSKTDIQAVLGAVPVTDQTVEYSKSSTPTAPTAQSEWQDSTTFTGLTANTRYYFFARAKQTATAEAGGVSSSLEVTTKTSSANAPAVPSIGTGANKPTSDSITVNTVAGSEYYISTSPTAGWSGTPNGYFKATENETHQFDSLSPATQYYIHVRVAETETAMPSVSASVMQYTAQPKPAANAGYSINYATEKITVDSGYEVNTATNFAGIAVGSNATLTANTTYYVRVAATGGVPASEVVSFEIPARPVTPTAITEENITKTDIAITIANTVLTQQYSVDNCATWQTGNDGSLSFNDLTAHTEYSVVTRIPSTNASFASEPSDTLSVTTKTAPVSLSDSGVTYSIKNGTINGLVSIYEYSLDNGTTWKTEPFSGITFAAGNVIQVRTKETADAMPSQPQTLGTVHPLSAAPAYAIDFNGEKTTASVPVTVEYNTSSETETTWTTGENALLALLPDTDYYFRVAATDTALAGSVQTLAVPARPQEPETDVITIAEGADASHTSLALADSYEYLLADALPAASEAGTAGGGSETEITATGGQRVYIRQKAVAGSSFASNWTDCGEVQLGVDSITLTGVGFDVAAGKLTGTTANMEYQIAGGDWTSCTAPDTSGIVFAAGTVKARQTDKTTNERAIITIDAPTVSAAPELDSKTYNSVTLTAVTGYEYSRDGGVTWQDSNVFSGLSGSTAYSFVARIKATAAALPGTISTALSVTTSTAPSGSGSTAPDIGAPVIVDGKTQNIGTEKKSGDATTVTVDQSKLGTNIGTAASGSSVVVPVSENGSATASLVVKNIEDMAAKGMTLTVQTGSVAYNLSTSAIDTAALAAAFPGADMSKVPFEVTISNSSVRVESETLVLSPVAFTVTATYGGKSVDVDTFSAYIDRVIEVTAEQVAKITTAVVVSADGSVRHVPTNVMEKDGKYYAVVSSRTNSTYALIQNEVTFADAKGKWYEAAVNEMGSRKIIGGRSAAVFDGEASITRAEFSAILVRALGLPADGESNFSDVSSGAWYSASVATAVRYGLTDGKGDSRFEPDAQITRQEAMLMLKRAAVLTEFGGTGDSLSSFTDADSVSPWALEAAKWSVGSGLIQGADGRLSPTADITRAESAAIILRLLQKAELVDMRGKV